MDKPPFLSDLFYSVQNEDFRTELEVLRRVHRGAPLRVLMVASAGENPLSVLADPMVGEVHAVDTNPAQVHLCELRRRALGGLSRDDQLALLGADGAAPGARGAARRLALYEAVRPRLPAASRAFWDERRNRDLAFGTHYVGRNDVLMRDLQVAVRAAGFAPLERALRDDELPAWQSAYATVMTVPYFMHTFGLPSEAAAAKLAGLSGRVAECHFRALQQPGARQNYFVTTAFANRYAREAGEDGLPACLQQRHAGVLAEPARLDRLHLHIGSIFDQAEALAGSAGVFDLISLSNIADWMDDGQFAGVVTRMSRCLAPGGALLARTATGAPMIVEVTARLMRSDEALNGELARVERGPWFRTVAAGFRD
jgi:S-adenosylmethionine:diacylglycerol 3-amino-3-carboxypropyl transferase